MAKRFFEPKIETLDPEELRKLQLSLLKKLLERAYLNSRFYRSLFDEGNVCVEDFQFLEDLQNFPFLDAEEIEAATPFGLTIAPRRHLREAHLSLREKHSLFSAFITKRDLRHWGKLVARGLWSAGVREGHLVLNTYPYGIDAGSFAYHYGIQALGAVVVPAGNLRVESQKELLSTLPINALCSSVEHALYLSEGKERQVKRSSKTLIGIFNGTPWTPYHRERIEKSLHLVAYAQYGLRHLLGPAMASECSQREGYHVWADAFLVECIDPERLEWVEEGQLGELVWTWLSAEGSAIIRYRSGDIASLSWSPCPCGRTHPRISRIRGRIEESVIISGYLVLAPDVAEALHSFPEVSGKFRIIVERPRALDHFLLEVEMAPEAPPEDRELCRRLRIKIAEAVKRLCGPQPTVELVPYGKLSNSTPSPIIQDRRRIAD